MQCRSKCFQRNILCNILNKIFNKHFHQFLVDHRLIFSAENKLNKLKFIKWLQIHATKEYRNSRRNPKFPNSISHITPTPKQSSKRDKIFYNTSKQIPRACERYARPELKSEVAIIVQRRDVCAIASFDSGFSPIDKRRDADVRPQYFRHKATNSV